MERARSLALVVFVPLRSGNQLFTAVALKPRVLKRALRASLPPSRSIRRLVAVLSLTRIISVATSWVGKRVPRGLEAIHPAPPPTTGLVSVSGSFQLSFPASSSSRVTSKIGVLMALAAGRAVSGDSCA